MTDSAVFLLADPDGARRAARSVALAGEDICLHEAVRGSQALELAALHKPDAVLIDLDLADPDGLEVYNRLKADARFTSPLILAVPATTSATRKALALTYGADAYVVEPADAEAFAAIVRSTLRLGRAERERSALQARLRAAQSEVEQFAAQVCHDVEEPLRAVTTFVQLVEERGAAGLTENERGYLDHVLAASARVRCLLRGFLSYAQTGRGRLAHFGRLELRAAAAAAVQSVRKRAEESHTTIVLEQPWPVVWGDFGQLQQVFEQVIRNAIDYRRPGSNAAVTIGAKGMDGQDWVVAITDNGSGIAPDFHSAIFLPFKRLHGREIPGAGMGLAISKKIVEAHGGRMWVESQPGAGASFCFTVRGFEAREHAAPGSVR